MDLQLVTLGGFALNIGNVAVPPFRTQKARALIAYLVSHQARDVSRERLVELFWPEFDSERAREALRTTLSTIRHGLRHVCADPSEVMFTDKSVVQWRASTDFDAARFALLATGPDETTLREAQTLYNGDFLEGNYDDWVVAERSRLSEIYENVLSRLVKQVQDVNAARELIGLNPYAESAYVLLIEAESNANRRNEADLLVRRYYEALNDVGGKPSAEFAQRFESVLTPEKSRNGLILPFVGRSEELDTLHRTLTQEPEYGALSLIIGQAGIGKSSILQRAAETAHTVGRHAFIVRCAQAQTEGGLNAWRRLFERLSGNSFDEVAGKPDLAAYVAGAVMSALPRRSALFVDDAHALRGEALETLFRIVRELRYAGHPIVITSRPEGQETLSSLMGNESELIALGPLQRVEVHSALSRAMNAREDELAEALYQRSGGHPLFLVSLVDSLVQKRALQQREGRWRIIRNLVEHLELPRDLRASVEARLRAAGDDAAVVACALALEPSARVDQIASALAYDEETVLDAIDRLLGFSLIAEDHAARFTFNHDVVREVAASILNIGRRVALHRAFARCFEHDPSSEAQLRLGAHLRAAGLLQPAASAYVNAARKAIDRYRFRDGLEWTGEALQLAQRDDKTEATIELLSQANRIRAYAYAHIGELNAGVESADEAVRYARSSVNHMELQSSLLVRGSLKGLLGDLQQQVSDSREVAQLADELQSASAASRAKLQAAAAARSSGDAIDAITLAREARALAERANDPVAQYAAEEELLRTQCGWWLFDDATRTLSDSAPLAEIAGAFAQSRRDCMDALCLFLMDRWNEAVAALSRAERHLKNLAERSDTVPLDTDYPVALLGFMVQFLKSRIACARARWDDALRSLEQCRTTTAAVNISQCRMLVDMFEILALLSRRKNGDVQQAEERLRLLPQDNAPLNVLMCIETPKMLEAIFLGITASPRRSSAFRKALDALEENAHRMPLDCDRRFGQLAEVAAASGEDAIATRAAEQHAVYRAARIAAAAACGRGVT